MAKNPYAHYARRQERPGITPEQMIQMMSTGFNQWHQTMKGMLPDTAKLQEGIKDLKGHQGLTDHIKQKATKLEKKLQEGLEKDMYFALTSEGAAIGKELVSLYDASQYNVHEERFKTNTEERKNAGYKMKQLAVNNGAISFYDAGNKSVEQVTLGQLARMSKEEQQYIRQNALTNEEEFQLQDRLYSPESGWTADYSQRSYYDDVMEKIDKQFKDAGHSNTGAGSPQIVKQMFPNISDEQAASIAEQGLMPDSNIFQLGSIAENMVTGGFITERDRDALTARYAEELFNKGEMPTAKAIDEMFIKDINSKLQAANTTKLNDQTPSAGGESSGGAAGFDPKEKLNNGVYALSQIGDSEYVPTKAGRLEMQTMRTLVPSARSLGDDGLPRQMGEVQDLMAVARWDKAMTMGGDPLPRGAAESLYFHQDEVFFHVLPLDPKSKKPVTDLSKHSAFQTPEMKKALQEANHPNPEIAKRGRAALDKTLEELERSGLTETWVTATGTMPMNTNKGTIMPWGDSDDSLYELFQEGNEDYDLPDAEARVASGISNAREKRGLDTFEDHKTVTIMAPASSLEGLQMKSGSETRAGSSIFNGFKYEAGGKLPQQAAQPLEAEEKLPNFDATPAQPQIKFLPISELLKGRR